MSLRNLFLGAVGAFAIATGACAQAPATISYPFEDTPANRAYSENARKEMLRIDAERGHLVQVGDIRMHYLEWGKKGDTPLIWTGGLTATGFQMMIVGPQLAAAGYHVFAVSPRGHGRTDLPSPEISYYTMADDLVGLMDKLKIKCAVIGGSSLGGWVTAAFYDDYPQRTLGLVMGDGGTMPRQAQLEQNGPAFLKAHPEVASGTIAGVFSHDDPFKAFQDTVNERLGDLGTPALAEMGPFFWSTIKQDANGKYVPVTPADAMLGTLKDFADPTAGYRSPLLQRTFRSMLPEVIFRHLDVPMVIIEPQVQTFGHPGPYNELLMRQHPNFVKIVKYPDTPHPFIFVHPEWVVRDINALLPVVKQTRRPGCS
jgi:pimeloyl-ACP methyl ester carboxylesterase